MTGPVLALLAGLSFVAAFVQGATGLGFALIVAPVIGIVAPGMLPVALLLMMLPLNAQVFWRDRAHVDRRGVWWITAGRVPGTLAGVWLLAALTTRQLSVATGWFTLVAAAVALVAPPFQPTRAAAVAVGAVTGITETSTGIGGPPLALLYQHAQPAVLRATVSLCFILGEVMALAVLSLGGQITGAQVKAAAVLVPPVMVGAWLARHSHSRISARRLRLAVLVFAVVSGVYLILR